MPQTVESSANSSASSPKTIRPGSVLGAIAFLVIIYFPFVRWKKRKMERENEAGELAISLRPVSRPQELENHIQSVAHEKVTGPQDIRAELAIEPMGRIGD